MRRTTPSARLLLVALTLTTLTAIARAPAASAKPWLGVYTQEITSDLREGLDLRGASGVLVSRVVSGGPAERAGVRQGDVIVRVDLRDVDSPEALSSIVADAGERQGVALHVLRDGEARTITVTLGSRPGDGDAPSAPRSPSPSWTPEDREDRKGDAPRDVRVKVFRDGEGPKTYHFDGDLDELPGNLREKLRDLPGLDGMGGLHTLRVIGAGRGRLGVRIESLNEGLATALGESGTDGVLVLEVYTDTPAERAGLRSGDVILTVEGRDVKDAESLVKALRDVDGKVSLTVSRKGARRTVEAELAATPRTDRGVWQRAAPGRRGETDREDRLRVRSDAGDSDLRQQLEELRQQLRELRQQLDERRHE